MTEHHRHIPPRERNTQSLHDLSDDALSAEMRRLLQPSEIVPPMPDPAGTRRRIMAAAEHPLELTPEEQADIDFILSLGHPGVQSPKL